MCVESVFVVRKPTDTCLQAGMCFETCTVLATLQSRAYLCAHVCPRVCMCRPESCLVLGVVIQKQLVVAAGARAHQQPSVLVLLQNVFLFFLLKIPFYCTCFRWVSIQ